MMQYRGYDADITYVDGDDAIHGSVINIADTIHFQGRTVDELRTAFHESVDDYLAWCAESDRAPAKPYSGMLMLRMDPNLHRRAALAAGPRKLNSYIVAAIELSLASAQPPSKRVARSTTRQTTAARASKRSNGESVRIDDTHS